MHIKSLKYFLKKNIIKHRIGPYSVKNIRISFIALSILTFISTMSYWNSQSRGLAFNYEKKEIVEMENDRNFVMPDYKIARENIQPAIGLYVDNQLILATKNKDLLRNLLSDLKQKYIKDKNVCFSFVEDVRMDFGMYSSSKIISDEEVKQLILDGQKDIVLYQISEGDNLDLICEKFETTVEKIKELNNIQDELEIKNLSEINLEKFKKVIHIQYSKMENREVEIAFESIRIEDPNQFINYKKVIQEGANGLDIYSDEVTYIDDKETSRTNISHSTVKEKVDEQIVIGTKQIEDDNLIWPVPYTRNISSPFGYREKEFHKGIDISSPGIVGQDILACKSGTVIYADSNNSGYGKHIIISHEDRKTSTLYAHCNDLLVKSGDKVAKGQKIAKIGSTGKSTGNHLHFEIRINGKSVDPQDYF